MAKDKKPKGLTMRAWLKRKAKELKGGEKTYIGEKRQNEMKVARLIKEYEAKQAKKSETKAKAKKAEAEAEAKPEVKHAITAEERVEQTGMSMEELKRRLGKHK
ncbi:MAG: hypothetical protein ACWGQW_21485 [bacterium]